MKLNEISSQLNAKQTLRKNKDRINISLREHSLFKGNISYSCLILFLSE